MTELSPEILDKLEQSHVAKHIGNPYSDEALGDADNMWTELRACDLTNLAVAGCTPGRQTDWVGLSNSDHTYEQPDLAKLHQTFEEAARLLVPEEYQEVAKIYFNHSSSELAPGQHFTVDLPHIDGSFSRNSNFTRLRMWATATNAVPTGAYIGAVNRQDFETGRLTENYLRPEAVKDKALEFVELPLDTLVLLSPSMIHFAQRAKREVLVRHFLRWQLHY